MNRRLIELIPTLPLIQNPEAINEATRVEKDLRLFGYQARSFMFHYSDTFNVDISHFRMRNYFLPDTSFHRTFRSFFNRRKNDLTLGDLQAAIQYGKLNDAVLRGIAAKKPKIPRYKIYFSTSFHYKPELVVKYLILCIIMAALLGGVAYFFR